jgi:putative membrane protein
MMWNWHTGHFGAGGWIGMAFMIVFWIAVIVGIVYLIRYLVARPHPGQWQGTPPYGQVPGPGGTPPVGRGSEALRILEERYARGEIEQEEFLKRKADLTS